MPKWYKILVWLIWLFAQAFFLQIEGVYTGAESIVYQHQAIAWLKGEILQQPIHFSLYAGYTVLIFILKFLHLPLLLLYCLQVLASAYLLYRWLQYWQNKNYSNIAIWIGGILWSVSPIVQYWIPYLYSDTLFFILLNLCLLNLLESVHINAYIRNNWWLIIWLLITRPIGFLFIGVLFVYTLAHKPIFKKTALWLLFCGVVASLFVTYVLVYSKGYFYPLHNIEAHIYCGVGNNLSAYIVHPWQANQSVIDFFWKNPELSIRLLFSRLYHHFTVSRPFYSQAHNWLNWVYQLPVYLACIYALLTPQLQPLQKKIVVAGILLFSLPALVFCVDADNRFLLPVMPFLMVAATAGIEQICKRFHSNR
jgi:hypothetical protein